MLYSSSDCSGNELANASISYNLTSQDYSDDAECGYSDSCDYYAVLNCNNEMINLYSTNVCIVGQNGGVIYLCTDSTLEYVTYTNDECSGTGKSIAVDMTQFYTDDCYTVCNVFSAHNNNIQWIYNVYV